MYPVEILPNNSDIISKFVSKYVTVIQKIMTYKKKNSPECMFFLDLQYLGLLSLPAKALSS